MNLNNSLSQIHFTPSLIGRAGGESFLLLLLFLVGCGNKPQAVPVEYSETTDSLVIYPDYREVVVPPNIAPLNFMLCDEEASEAVVAFEVDGADAHRAYGANKAYGANEPNRPNAPNAPNRPNGPNEHNRPNAPNAPNAPNGANEPNAPNAPNSPNDSNESIESHGGSCAPLIVGAGADGKLDIDTLVWRQLLADAKGRTLSVTVYAHRPAGWVRYQPFSITVAEEEIDPFLSYRLIEPGYELYRQLGIYQRNLTNFDEMAVYENNRAFSNEDNHCINCHNYQAYDTERMLFHVRAAHGGTVIIHGTEAHKVAMKHDSILTSGVYPSWHPTMPLVAFSTNKTGQVFHMLHPEKIEVLDEASDLLLYDADQNTVRHILHTKETMETFPCWAPDGSRLYYCCAQVPPSLLGEHHPIDMALRYDSLLYDIYSMPFDPATRTFGEPRLEVDASGMGKSTSVPRISPDGRYLLFTLGDYGQFHIWHRSSDLWVKELTPTAEEAKKGEAVSSMSPMSPIGPMSSMSPIGPMSPISPISPMGLRPLTAANSAEWPDSYHTWSSNGRWIVFASRRDDHNYSRVFIAYFDREGQAHRAFMLPQRDPQYNTLLLKSYNVPELTKRAVQVSHETLRHVIYHTEADNARYE